MGEDNKKEKKEWGTHVAVLEKIICPNCGYEYDTSYPKCPNCSNKGNTDNKK